MWGVVLVGAIMMPVVGRASEKRVALENELIATLEQIVKDMKLGQSAGTVTYLDVLNAEVKWKKAQRRFASDLSAKISIQKTIVSLVERGVKSATLRAKNGIGVVSPHDVSFLQARYLREQIRLIKFEEQLKQ